MQEYIKSIITTLMNTVSVMIAGSFLQKKPKGILLPIIKNIMPQGHFIFCLAVSLVPIEARDGQFIVCPDAAMGTRKKNRKMEGAI